MTETPVWRWWPVGSCWQLVWSVCCSALDPTGSSPAALLHSLPCCLHTRKTFYFWSALKPFQISNTGTLSCTFTALYLFRGACFPFIVTFNTKMSHLWQSMSNKMCTCVLQFLAWCPLYHSMSSVQCHHEWWTINKLAVNKVNLPKGINVFSLKCECVRLQDAHLTLYCRVLEQKNKQKSSHASVPVRGTLKLCVSSALNYWLRKSDRMNKSEAQCFFTHSSTAIMSILSNKLTTVQRAFNIWNASPPLCHMNCLFL